MCNIFSSNRKPILLILRALKLGDLLVAVPAIKGLRRAYPHHHIILAAPGWLQQIVDLIDSVDQLIPFKDLNEPIAVTGVDIDIAVNMHGNGKESAQRINELNAKKVISYDPKVSWIENMHERERWVRLVAAFGVNADAQDVEINKPYFAQKLIKKIL